MDEGEDIGAAGSIPICRRWSNSYLPSLEQPTASC
jgi:hypothetical protein